MTTTERAAEIRKALKAKGWSSRKVSVRADYFSMGSSIDVRIKDPAVPLAAVKAIATAHESIRRDEYSGEILSGGNRYVSVSYSHDALAALRATWAPGVIAALNRIGIEGTRLEPVEGTPFLVGRPTPWRVTLWKDAYVTEGTAESIAETIGSLLVEA